MTTDELQREIRQASHDVEVAFSAWSIADTLYAESRWLTYQAAKARLNALTADAKGRDQACEVTLPWLKAKEEATA